MMTEVQNKQNPFTNKFIRKMNSSGAWVTVGEERAGTIDIAVELNEYDLLRKLIETTAAVLDISTATEKLVLDFIFMKSTKFELREEPVFIDLEAAQKYFSKRGKAISKSSFQRSMKKLLKSGIIAPTNKKSWFYLNPDVFDLGTSFLVKTKYVLRKTNSRCAETSDFLCEDEPMFVLRR
jgi:hypothetical protein